MMPVAINAPPLEGGFPTTSWDAGDTIQDAYQVVVPPDLRGQARLLIGLYRPDSGERLQTETGADTVTAATLDIAPP